VCLVHVPTPDVRRCGSINRAAFYRKTTVAALTAFPPCFISRRQNINTFSSPKPTPRHHSYSVFTCRNPVGGVRCTKLFPPRLPPVMRAPLFATRRIYSLYKAQSSVILPSRGTPLITLRAGLRIPETARPEQRQQLQQQQQQQQQHIHTKISCHP